MRWAVRQGAEFAAWWRSLTAKQRDDVTAAIELLHEYGPRLPFPHSSGVAGSRYGHLRELRVQSGGRPIRVFCAFDSRRVARLLIGGEKTGDDRFYERMVPRADALYEAHLARLGQKGTKR